MATRTQVLSLFGATPEQIRERQAREEAQLLQSIRDPYQQTGQAIGSAIGRLFSGPSTEETQAMRMQEALQGVDVSDPEALREVARTVSTFAPDRALMILDRASQVEGEVRQRKIDDITLDLRTTQAKASKFELAAAEEDRPDIKAANQLAKEIKDLELQIAQNKLTDQTERKDREKQVKTDAVKFLKEKGLNEWATLTEKGLITPDASIKAWIDTQNPELDLIEIGNYTTEDGTPVLGAYDKTSKSFLQYTPSGWIRSPKLTQGKPDTERKPTVPNIINKKSQDYKTYNTLFENRVDLGTLFGLDVSDTDQEIQIQSQTGISDLNSDAGRLQLFNRAEQIRRQDGVGIEEALDRALQGERPDQTQEAQQPQSDPYAGATIRSN